MLDKKEVEVLLGEIYDIAKNDLRAEVYKEVFDRKEKRIQYTEKAKLLYDKFRYDNPIVLKHLRKELPLRVRLLNKVHVIGMALLYEDIIQYTYYFNNDSKRVFIYRPHISDMEMW